MRDIAHNAQWPKQKRSSFHRKNMVSDGWFSLAACLSFRSSEYLMWYTGAPGEGNFSGRLCLVHLRDGTPSLQWHYDRIPCYDILYRYDLHWWLLLEASYQNTWTNVYCSNHVNMIKYETKLDIQYQQGFY